MPLFGMCAIERSGLMLKPALDENQVSLEMEVA
jgi:hypothetical protein